MSKSNEANFVVGVASGSVCGGEMWCSKSKHERIMDGTYGFGVKFVHEYCGEMRRLDASIRNGYDNIFAKLANIYSDFKKKTPQTQQTATGDLTNSKKRKTIEPVANTLVSFLLLSFLFQMSMLFLLF